MPHKLWAAGALRPTWDAYRLSQTHSWWGDVTAPIKNPTFAVSPVGLPF